MKIKTSEEIQFLLNPRLIIKRQLIQTIPSKKILLQLAKISLIIGVLVSFSSMQYMDFWVLIDGAICWSFLPLLVIGLSYLVNKVIFSSNLKATSICYVGLLAFSPWLIFLLLVIIAIFIMQFIYPNVPNPVNTKTSFVTYGYLFTSIFTIYGRFLIHKHIHQSKWKAFLATLFFEIGLLSFILGFFYFSDQLMPRIIDGFK